MLHPMPASLTPKLVTVLREGYGPGALRADAVAGLICRYLGLPADTGTTGVDGAGTTGRS